MTSEPSPVGLGRDVVLFDRSSIVFFFFFPLPRVMPESPNPLPNEPRTPHTVALSLILATGAVAEARNQRRTHRNPRALRLLLADERAEQTPLHRPRGRKFPRRVRRNLSDSNAIGSILVIMEARRRWKGTVGFKNMVGDVMGVPLLFTSLIHVTFKSPRLAVFCSPLSRHLFARFTI